MESVFQYVTNELSPLHGHSIKQYYEFNDEWPEPRRVMFIYIRINRNQTIVVDQYMYDMAENENIDDVEIKLIYNARPGEKNPAAIAKGFDKISFGWEPCYVVYFLDEELWKFHPFPDDPLVETIVFRKNKMTLNEKTGLLVKREYTKNNSFFNFKRGEFDGRQLIRFVNFMRDENGEKIVAPDPRSDPSGWNAWEYCMDIYICLQYHFSENGQNKWLTVIVDPVQDNGGTGGPPPK